MFKISRFFGSTEIEIYLHDVLCLMYVFKFLFLSFVQWLSVLNIIFLEGHRKKRLM